MLLYWSDKTSFKLLLILQWGHGMVYLKVWQPDRKLYLSSVPKPRWPWRISRYCCGSRDGIWPECGRTTMTAVSPALRVVLVWDIHSGWCYKPHTLGCVVFWLLFRFLYKVRLNLSYVNILLSGLSGRRCLLFLTHKKKPALSRQLSANRKIKSQTYFRKFLCRSAAPIHTIVPLSGLALSPSEE